MVLLSPLLHGIKMGDHWTLKTFLTTSLTTSLMTVSIHSLGASIIQPILQFCRSNYSNLLFFK